MTVIKLTGAAVIVVSFFKIGENYIKNMNARICGLNDMSVFLNDLASSIKYDLSSIPDFLKNVSKENPCYGFSKIITNNLKEKSLKNSWDIACESLKKDMKLSSEDIKILKNISLNLGLSDAETQIKNIKYYSNKLNYELNDLKRKYKENKKTALSLSIFAGLIITIMLI